jgi:hypothetical protein
MEDFEDELEALLAIRAEILGQLEQGCEPDEETRLKAALFKITIRIESRADEDKEDDA